MFVSYYNSFINRLIVVSVVVAIWKDADTRVNSDSVNPYSHSNNLLDDVSSCKGIESSLIRIISIRILVFWFYFLLLQRC